jgi:hypothetical protein
MSMGDVERQTTEVLETLEFPFQVGLGGTDYQISIIPRFPDAADARDNSDPQGRPGDYKVIITLGRPGFSAVPERRFFGHEQHRGDSHLAITPPALPIASVPDGAQHIEIHTQTPDGDFAFLGYPNEQGFLGTVVADSVWAQTVDDAVTKVAKAIAPSLSNLAAHLDIPLRVQQTEVVEARNGARHLIFQVAYNEAPFFPPGTTALSEDLMRCTSYYREALGSNTPAYQFLCFYKILEAIRIRREHIARETRERGETVTAVQERVPAQREMCVPWLNAIFPVRPAWDDLDLKSIFLDEACGRKFNRIVDDDLRPLRHAVAHSLLDDKETAVPDGELTNTRKLSKWLPLTKCMVRRVLKNEFPYEFLTSLKDPTSE